MTHFEHMEKQGQLTIFDLEEMKFKKKSTNVSKPVDKKLVVVPRKVGYIVR